MEPLRSPWRWGAALLLVVNAAVHVPLVPDHLEEAPYIGVLFILLCVACVLLAALVVVVDSPLVWSACAGLSLVALAAFVASRTVGLPQIEDEVGNWTEPLGYPTMAAEVLTVLVAAAALGGTSRRPVVAD